MKCHKCSTEMVHHDSYYDSEWTGEDYEDFYFSAYWSCDSCYNRVYEADYEYESPEK